MQTIQYTKYGGPEVMHLDEVPIPVINKGQLLIKIKAAAINPIDWKIRNGDYRWLLSNRFPKRMGCDFSGVVIDYDKNVNGFKCSDEVFGYLGFHNCGAFGEYVAVDENNVHRIPDNISFSEATCLPLAGATAWQGLCEVAKVKKNDFVLINGCTGGVGVFAVQIAKMRGAHVVGVCAAENESIAKKVGVDFVLNYDKQEIINCGRSFNIIIDLSNKLPYHIAKHSLKKGGIYFNARGSTLDYFLRPVRNVFHWLKKMPLKTKMSHEVLNHLYELGEKKLLSPQVGKTFALKDAILAMNYLESGGKVSGKAILLMDN